MPPALIPPALMPTAPDLIIFDWDGTIVDSTQTIAEAIRQACRDLGLSVPSMDAASYVIGLGLQDALNYVAPGLGPAEAQALSERFRHHYLERDQFLRPFAGMEALLAWIESYGLPMAVATGKSRRGLERAFDATRTRAYFATSRCADESVPKPGPEMVIEICEELLIEPSRVLVVGDTTHDIQMAKAAGAAVVAVGYGAHPAERLLKEEPLALMGSVAQLTRYIQHRLAPTLHPEA